MLLILADLASQEGQLGSAELFQDVGALENSCRLVVERSTVVQDPDYVSHHVGKTDVHPLIHSERYLLEIWKEMEN